MATWPAQTWYPAEFVTADMMNGVRDQLNELHTFVTYPLVDWSSAVSLTTYEGTPIGGNIHRCTYSRINPATINFVFVMDGIGIPIATRSIYMHINATDALFVSGYSIIASAYHNVPLYLQPVDPYTAWIAQYDGNYIPAGSLMFYFSGLIKVYSPYSREAMAFRGPENRIK